MNPFELQAQFARQWFDLMQTIATTAMTACTSMNQQAAAAWGQALPSAPTPSPAPAPFFAFPWLSGMTAPAPWAFSTPFAANAWQSNPFAAWMTLFSGNPATFPTFPGFPTLPFAPAMAQFWTPWTFSPTATTASWTAPFSTPSCNSGVDLLEQMATNYRTASGYAVAAIIGPLNAALDPRTYGEPWWQKLDKNKKLN